MCRVFIYTILCASVILAACAPAYDGGRTTKDGGRTTNVLAMVTPVPTWTATPLPTATATVTITPTPTRTLSPAEVRAARLPALPGFSWRADGDAVKLYDAKNQAVAVFDQKTGAIRWYNSGNQKHFAAIEPYLGANYQNRKELAKWLSDLKAQGIHFITFADSREGFPPYIVIPTPDGNDVQMISSKKGTADFVYDAKTEKILGVFPDGSGYYYLNPDGSFDLKPLEVQANDIADKLLASGVIQHPDPAKAKFIRDATASAIMINPYGATPKEINDFIKSRTGKDFAEHFNRTWGDKVGVTYDQVMAATLAQSPNNLFADIDYIGQNKNSICKNTCWWSGENDTNLIYIVERDLGANSNFPLPLILVKEAYGNESYNAAWMIASRKGITGNQFGKDGIGSHIGEAISLAIESYTMYQHQVLGNPFPRSEEMIDFLIDWAFKGGIIH